MGESMKLKTIFHRVKGQKRCRICNKPLSKSTSHSICFDCRGEADEILGDTIEKTL